MYFMVNLNESRSTLRLPRFQGFSIVTIIVWLFTINVSVRNAFEGFFFQLNFISITFCFSPADTSDTVEERTVVVGIVTQIDLLNYITNHIQI